MAEKIEFRTLVEVQDWEGMERFVKSKQKFNYKYGIDLLFSKGHHGKVAEFVNNFDLNSIQRKEAKEYQDRWFSSMKGKSLVHDK